MKQFDFSYNIHEAMDSLSAYDSSGPDFGSNDSNLKQAVKKYLRSLSKKDRTALIEQHCKTYFLSPKAQKQGYGEDDAEEFKRWVEDLL